MCPFRHISFYQMKYILNILFVKMKYIEKDNSLVPTLTRPYVKICCMQAILSRSFNRKVQQFSKYTSGIQRFKIKTSNVPKSIVHALLWC